MYGRGNDNPTIQEPDGNLCYAMWFWSLCWHGPPWLMALRKPQLKALRFYFANLSLTFSHSVFPFMPSYKERGGPQHSYKERPNQSQLYIKSRVGGWNSGPDLIMKKTWACCDKRLCKLTINQFPLVRKTLRSIQGWICFNEHFSELAQGHVAAEKWAHPIFVMMQNG